MWLAIALLAGASVFVIANALLSFCQEKLAVARSVQRGNVDIVPWRDYPEVFLEDLNAGPSFQQRAAEYDRLLTLAGRGKPWTGMKYQSVAEAAAGGVFLVFVLLLPAGGTGIVTSVVFGAVLAWFVWWLSAATLRSWVETRRKSVSREFPYFLDLAVMNMGAGGTFLEALNTYTSVAQSAALVNEIRSLAAEISLGNTTDTALANLEARLPSDDVVGVIRSVRQGLRMGTPLNVLLREQAEQLRFSRSQLAERSAEELKVRLQGPTMLLMIAVLLLVLGPVIIGMTKNKVF
jgi:Flp pilus assembly protein TadB